jgi:hypothetical protein
MSFVFDPGLQRPHGEWEVTWSNSLHNPYALYSYAPLLYEYIENGFQ